MADFAIGKFRVTDLVLQIHTKIEGALEGHDCVDQSAALALTLIATLEWMRQNDPVDVPESVVSLQDELEDFLADCLSALLSSARAARALRES